MPSLFVIQGRNKGTRYELSGHEGAITIGREAGNLIQLQDNEVSRRHAEIRAVGEQFILGDLKSSNGTFVNNRKIQRSELTAGDQLQIGRTVLVYAAGNADEPVVGAVDIVPASDHSDASRIVRSMPEDDAEMVVLSPEDTQNQWLARARSNLQVMYRTALAVSHTLDIDELLGRILQLIFEWVEADRGCIMLLDPETRQLSTKARRDRQGSESGESMVISRTILDYVLQRREGVLTSDAQDDDRFSSGQSVLRTGVREAICVPMQGRYDTVGVIYVDTTVPLSEVVESGQRRFTDEHLKLMIAIGHQAALAVEDTTYYSAMVQSERLAAVGQTIATLSHHIKNILQGIRGGSYLIDMGFENDDLAVLKKGWDIVARNQNKISSLVMDMLSFSKEREPVLAEASLVEVISEVVETVARRADESGITLSLEPPGEFPPLLFDSEALSKAILNVVTNALDAVEEHAQEQADAPREVTISLAADPDSQLARITVADTGGGMDPETLATVFNLFVSSKGSRGTGLGLTVSRKILREHGGDITATSVPGEGSRFILELPMVPVEATASAEAADDRADDPPGGTLASGTLADGRS